MKLKLFLFGFLLSIVGAGCAIESQSPQKQEMVYNSSTHEKGMIVFQLKKSAKIIPSSQNMVQNYSVSVLKSVSAYGIKNVRHLYPTVKNSKLNRTYRVEISDTTDMNAARRALANHPDVLYAEFKNKYYFIHTPNDLGLNTISGQWALWKIKSQEAWDINKGDTNIVVAVSDDAFLMTHPDLQNKFVKPYDAAGDVITHIPSPDNDPSPCGGSDGSHGTHTAGTVGAQTNNNIGVASIGYNISVMPIKIGNCLGELIAANESIIWAADNGADIISCSWGGPGTVGSQEDRDVITYAISKGCILVFAAGNCGDPNGQYPDPEGKCPYWNIPYYPAKFAEEFPEVISVASTNINDIKSSFSNFGSYLKISAPGSFILSSVSYSPFYDWFSGTSMACPHVSGLLGLMKSAKPTATNEELINCLLTTTDNIDNLNPTFIGKIGTGRINAKAALECITGSPPPPPPDELDAGISQVTTPTATPCVTPVVPVVTLKNYGSITLTSVTIEYFIDTGTPQTYSWTGTLASGATTSITLGSITLPAGIHTFTARTKNPNGETDDDTGNDATTINYNYNVLNCNCDFVTKTFPNSPLARASGTGSVSTTLSFTKPSKNIEFTISGIGSSFVKENSNRYIERILISYTDNSNNLKQYGVFNGNIQSTVKIKIPAIAKNVTVKLDNGYSSSYDGNLSVNLSNVNICEVK